LLGLPVDRRRRNRSGNWMSALDGFTLALGRFGIVIAPVLPFASIRKGCDCRVQCLCPVNYVSQRCAFASASVADR
jgi:hypothetical protein